MAVTQLLLIGGLFTPASRFQPNTQSILFVRLRGLYIRSGFAHYNLLPLSGSLYLCLHKQNKRHILLLLPFSCLFLVQALKMEVTCFSGTSNEFQRSNGVTSEKAELFTDSIGRAICLWVEGGNHIVMKTSLLTDSCKLSKYTNQ